ncbi:hypothetical protein NQ317_011179 [Molorchus minor]|uniref:Pyrroline-5-carboxylate reductase dimerisation domain-containing protein n=1 Tax=Molorchus minor TaxID=1323400 RepID=A0ABQ9JK63_9CUCU|nr:hypothetical protein NQ317_011179 [Molorchus minor]
MRSYTSSGQKWSCRLRDWVNNNEADARVTKRLFESVGTCEQVTEGLLDAITALSGSGPAYIYVLIEALADGGVKMGLPRDLAYRLASKLSWGQLKWSVIPKRIRDFARMMLRPGWIDGGWTTFLEKGFPCCSNRCDQAATERCREVSKIDHTK